MIIQTLQVYKVFRCQARRQRVWKPYMLGCILLNRNRFITDFQKQRVMNILLYYLEYDLRVDALRVFSLSFGKIKAFFSNELIVVKCV